MERISYHCMLLACPAVSVSVLWAPLGAPWAPLGVPWRALGAVLGLTSHGPPGASLGRSWGSPLMRGEPLGAPWTQWGRRVTLK